jgi:hypothetical protein
MMNIIETSGHLKHRFTDYEIHVVDKKRNETTIFHVSKCALYEECEFFSGVPSFEEDKEDQKEKKFWLDEKKYEIDAEEFDADSVSLFLSMMKHLPHELIVSKIARKRLAKVMELAEKWMCGTVRDKCFEVIKNFGINEEILDKIGDTYPYCPDALISDITDKAVDFLKNNEKAGAKFIKKSIKNKFVRDIVHSILYPKEKAEKAVDHSIDDLLKSDESDEDSE